MIGRVGIARMNWLFYAIEDVFDGSLEQHQIRFGVTQGLALGDPGADSTVMATPTAGENGKTANYIENSRRQTTPDGQGAHLSISTAHMRPEKS